jgi:formate hydrogenlyase subunit 6/NADH:ubiquinone oxidoreductase subunit I
MINTVYGEVSGTMAEQAWMPRINRKHCTGCRACVEMCPTQALAQVAGKAELVRPDSCVYCDVCENVCPAGAIELPFLIRKATTDEQTK